MRILLVEDEANIAKGLILNLEMQGYQVTWSADGADALTQWNDHGADLIILDLMLPKIDGFGVLKNIREKDPVVPVLILSAKDSSQDKIKGLKLGSDDYLEKPFDLEELLARVERMLKRSELTSQTKTKSLEGVFQFGSNSINFSSRKAITLQGEVELTAQELSLLKLFIENEGDPLSREKLLDVGWGYKKGTESRTVDNFVVRMRKYFEEDPKVPRHFQSVRSFGYKFIS